MLSRRTIARSRVIFTHTSATPVVVARIALGSVAVYGRSISLYTNSYGVKISDQFITTPQLSIRKFTSSMKYSNDDSEFEIDLITLKKTSKKKPAKKVSLIPEDVGLQEQFRISKQLVRTAIREANEELSKQQPVIAPMLRTEEYVIDTGDAKEALSVKKLNHYYNELMTLRKYLLILQNNSDRSPWHLTNQELLYVLTNFKHHYDNGAIPEIRKDNINKYDNMCGYLMRLLQATSNPNFTIILENYIVDTGTYRAGVNFLQSGLIWFDQEILSLIKKYHLEEASSVYELIKYLEDITNSKRHLAHEFHDSVYFRNKVTFSRYQQLINILTNVNLTITEIVSIIQNSSYAIYREHLVALDKSRTKEAASALAGKWHLLASVGLIDKSTNFYEIAPTISAIANDSTKPPGLKQSAEQLLQGCTNAIIKDPQALEYFSDYSWFKMCSVSNQLQDNYLFSALVSKAIPLDQLRNLNEIKWKEIKERSPGLEALGVDSKYVGRFYTSAKVASAYCKAIGCPSYYRIPNHEQLWKYSEYLQSFRSSLGKNFKDVDEKAFKNAVVSIRLGQFDEDVDLEKMKHLSQILIASKEYYARDLYVLDDLLEDYKKQDVYKQIPDTMSLESYIEEINYLKSELGFFSNKDVFMKKFSQLIQDVVNKSQVLPGNVDYYNLLNLEYRLSKFCRGNSSNCLEILNSVLLNHDVFGNLESSLANKSREYKQIPDDFFLEEYFVELCQLKVALEVSKFENTSTNAILSKIESMANEEELDLEKRIIWRKLYINLARLFKHNNGHTGALDAVISSAFKFMEFESAKSSKKSIREAQPSIIGQHVAYLRNNSYDIVSSLLDPIQDCDNMGLEMFYDLCEEYINALDKYSPEYLYKVTVIDELEENNYKIQHYPTFLYRLFDFIKAHPEKRMTITPTEIEGIYTDLIETLEYDKTLATFKPIDTKFDLNDFKKPVVPRVKYHDSENLLKILNKQETGADFKFVRDSTMVDSVKQGVYTALHEDHSNTAPKKNIVTTEDELEQMKAPFKIKGRVHSEDSQRLASSRQYDDEIIDTRDLESFLKQIKKEDESRKRESEAFEWSKAFSHENIDFSNIHNNDYSFILINMNGEAIPTEKEFIDGYLPKENIFEALNKFSEEELVKPIRSIKKFQKKNWKIVGSKFDGTKKYFVMARSRRNRRGTLYDKIKSLFAATGFVLVSLVGVNFLLEDPTVVKEEEIEDKGDIMVASIPPTPFTVTIPQDTPSTRVSTPVFGKEEFKDVVVDSNSESESNTESSWWRSLLWSSK